MTLRKKTLLFIGTAFLVLVMILFLVSRSILTERFASLEEQETRKNVERALSALAGDVSDLEAVTTDWAAWDDSYAFIEDANSQYIRANLVDGTFTVLRLNLMVFISSSGITVFGKAFDLHSNRETEMPLGLHPHLTQDGVLMTRTRTEGSIAGLLVLPEGPMIVVSQPILTTNDDGPARGALVTGRYLNASEIERLGKKAHLSLSVSQNTNPSLSADFQLVQSSLSNATPILIRPIDPQLISGYALLRDIYGRQSVILRMDAPRDIYQQGRAAIAFTMWAIIVVGLVLGAVTILVVERQVLSRLSRLSSNVLSVGTSGDLLARIPVTGSDELASLARVINGALAALQEAEQEYRSIYEEERGLRQALETEMTRRVEFTRALVHELKTPLTPVLTSSDMLITELKQEPLLSLAKNVNRGAVRLNNRIDELLDLARGEIGILRLAFTSVDLQLLLREAVADFTPVASRAGQSLSLSLPTCLSLLRADENRLRQIVSNLLSNACKFTPRGGKITVAARENADSIIVEVKDTGPGITKEEQQRLFQPYYRREEDRQHLNGLGLGLALCKTLVEVHTGRIWVESQSGKGSTFGFSIPLETVARQVRNDEDGGKS